MAGRTVLHWNALRPAHHEGAHLSNKGFALTLLKHLMGSLRVVLQVACLSDQFTQQLYEFVLIEF
jgi:hypothetical protein